MSDNPFESPVSDISGSPRDRRGITDDIKELKTIAKCQRTILYCILANIACLIVNFVLPVELRLIAAILLIVVAVISAFFLFRLASILYGTVLAIIFVIFSVAPCLGLLILLMVNGSATAKLQKNGIKVGFLGVNPDTIG
jgi:uncharacterized membrane protein